MKRLFLLFLSILFLNFVYSQATYNFTGNGNWTTASNWSDSIIPPGILRLNDTINIKPATGDSCVLNTAQTILAPTSLHVAPGAIFIIRGDISIGSDSTFNDLRDGQEYPFRHIGTQVWMTRNFNLVADSTKCYSNDPANCAVYGRLYNWYKAVELAPPGWHLPSDTEWITLINYLGGDSLAGRALKSITLWMYPNLSATNSSGFNGLGGGWGYQNDIFYFRNQFGFWWTSTTHVNSAVDGKLSQLNYNSGKAYCISYTNKATLCTVRYVRDW